MAKQTKKEILEGIENHVPEWLTWTQIKKKYPNKWLILGQKDIEQAKEGIYFDVWGVFDTFEEQSIFNEKYRKDFSKQYQVKTFKNTLRKKKTKKLYVSIPCVITK